MDTLTLLRQLKADGVRGYAFRSRMEKHVRERVIEERQAARIDALERQVLAKQQAEAQERAVLVRRDPLAEAIKARIKPQTPAATPEPPEVDAATQAENDARVFISVAAGLDHMQKQQEQRNNAKPK
jgi:hypothetical protein